MYVLDAGTMSTICSPIIAARFQQETNSQSPTISIRAAPASSGNTCSSPTF
jgi:hypothetical protein